MEFEAGLCYTVFIRLLFFIFCLIRGFAMRFIDDVFISAIDDVETVIYSLKRGLPVFNIYLLCVGENVPSVIVSGYEYFSGERYKDMYVAGISSGKYNAYRIYAEAVKYALENKWDINNIGQNLIKESKL